MWRYDPIVFSVKMTPDYHKRRFAQVAGELAGYTKRAVVSVVDSYRKAEPRMKALDEVGAGMADCDANDFEVSCATLRLRLPETKWKSRAVRKILTSRVTEFVLGNVSTMS